MPILGINYSHDRSACLIDDDGQILVAIEEERLDRFKHSLGLIFHGYLESLQTVTPLKSIRYCLTHSNLGIDDLDAIIVNAALNDVHTLALSELPTKHPDRIHTLPRPSHHLAHAASTYYCSPFDDAAIIVVDSFGSYTDHSSARIESESIFIGQGSHITPAFANSYDEQMSTLSLGNFYNYFTSKLSFVTRLGHPTFGTFECGGYAEGGKTMGLAPYGRARPDWPQLIRHTSRGLHIDTTTVHRSYLMWRAMADLEGELTPPDQPTPPGGRCHHDSRFGQDIARKAQDELTAAMIHLVNLTVQKTGKRNICLAGGVALNAVANGRILSTCDIDGLYIQPAAHDAGNAIGAALYGHHHILSRTGRHHLTSARLGSPYPDYHSRAAAHAADLTPIPSSPNDLATALTTGQLLGVLSGRSEFGPRALGGRSILADPRSDHTRTRLNDIKGREQFRPLAPIVLRSHVSEWFDCDTDCPFMIMAVPAKPSNKAHIPAVIHIDGTARIQTITPADGIIHDILQAFFSLTGIPVLINTSFNFGGEPIVETPAQAVTSFLESKLDILLLEHQAYRKPGDR